MPPRGTTGKSSSTGARGPTGPKGQARSSPAGNAGGKPGAVSRTSSTTRSTKTATKVAGGASKSQFQRFQERYPGGVSSMPVVSIPPPTPGGFGPAGGAVSATLSRARSVAGKLFGAERRAAAAAKSAAEIEKAVPQLNQMRRAEAARLGKPLDPGQLPQRTLVTPGRQVAAATRPSRVRDTFQTVNRRVDDVTDSFGFGKGKMARAKTAATLGGVQESGRLAAERKLGMDKYKNGGLVTKKGRVPPKGKK